MDGLISIRWKCPENHTHEARYHRRRLEDAVKIGRLPAYCRECGKAVDLDDAALRAIEERLKQQ